MDKAVTTTMEMESYLGPKVNHVAQVVQHEDCNKQEVEVAAVAKGNDTTVQLLHGY